MDGPHETLSPTKVSYKSRSGRGIDQVQNRGRKGGIEVLSELA